MNVEKNVVLQPTVLFIAQSVVRIDTERAFGYWFDFGDDWYHQVQVDRNEKAIPTVTYPRVIRRVGKSPPQYCNA